MQSGQQRTHPSQPRVFNYSLDWRFLLPVSHPDKTFVFFEDDSDFGQTLQQVGIPDSNQLSFLDVEQKEKKESASFVLPFGLPVRWVGKERSDQIEFFRSLRKLMGDNCNLLVGFHNSWNYRSHTQAKYYSSTPRRVTSQLHKAGFKTIKVFGVISNLSIPEYIFDLNDRSMHFAMQHRFKRKPVIVNLLSLLSHTTGVTVISDFLPCYFIGATG
jgi:hypothetical protein